MEESFSGYCRAIDAARLVLCEGSGGEWDIDCNFENCDYAHSCPMPYGCGTPLAGAALPIL